MEASFFTNFFRKVNDYSGPESPRHICSFLAKFVLSYGQWGNEAVKRENFLVVDLKMSDRLSEDRGEKNMKTYNLFISHSWAYSDAYDKLVALLDADSRFSYKNFSVPKDDPIHNAPNQTALYEAIKKQVSPAHVVIILVGVYATYSKWIDKEIKIATSEFFTPKPILAIEPWGAEKTSQKVKENADKIVKWNTASIVAAIRELTP